jgi:energy-coupling factor transporter ATP-binding protein EcfA2
LKTAEGEALVKYNLQHLGPTGFQDLAAALVVATFGAGVQVMGAGRDGGRDMYYRGQLVWAKTAEQPGEVWDGYTVFQVKQKAELASRPNDNATWLWERVRAELDEWADPKKGRDSVPDYLVIVTNVPLTPVPGTGGHDELNRSIEAYIANLADDSRDIGDAAEAERRAKLARISRIKKWRFWDGNQIQTLLDAYAGVRRAFPAFFTAADVFANLPEFTDSLPLSELEPGLRAHARTTLIGEGSIYFDEAGSGDSSGIPVHEIAIDLPVTNASGQRSTVIRQVLDRAEHVLKPTVTTVQAPRHLIVTGASGNGKTTISKFLVQVFRAAMLNGAADLSADQQRAISGTENALNRFDRRLPKHRRWAMRIDLAEYAQEGGLTEDSTLLRWISHKVSMRSDCGDVKPSVLQSWMKQWPWFLVLDGLDEVTESTLRKRLIQRITEFVNNAEAENCDVFVVLTTRPIGYTENIAPTQFERIDLDYLEPAEAVRYGVLATKVRLRGDVDRIEKVVKQLRQAAEDEALRNLLRTPLQVLILTIIVDGAGQLAPDRYSLFWGYYETVFKRERDKQGGLHHMLQEYGQQIQLLHERVGFELQVRSESGDRSFATLTPDELKQITWQVLDEAGFKPSGKDGHLLDSIFVAATQRLVLIAPRGDDGYGFDVRSLQELMAAMRLTTGPLTEVIERLRQAAASPHWRNTWIFASGRLFAIPQSHQHEAVVNLVESVDEGADDRLGNTAPIGPRLALEVIDDGMARSLPKWRERLIAHGLRVLSEPIAADLPAICRVLVRFADAGDDQRKAVAEGLRDALGGSAAARATAERVQALVPVIAVEVGAGIDARGLSGVRKRPNDVASAESPDGWEDFDAEVATYPASGEANLLLVQAADALRRMKAGGSVEDSDAEAVVNALSDSAVAKALAVALAHVVDHEPELGRALRDDVLPSVGRRPIGELLRD